LLWMIYSQLTFRQKRISVSARVPCPLSFKDWVVRHSTRKPRLTRSGSCCFTFPSARDLDFLFGEGWEVLIEIQPTRPRTLMLVSSRNVFDSVTRSARVQNMPFRLQFSTKSVVTLKNAAIVTMDQTFVRFWGWFDKVYD